FELSYRPLNDGLLVVLSGSNCGWIYPFSFLICRVFPVLIPILVTSSSFNGVQRQVDGDAGQVSFQRGISPEFMYTFPKPDKRFLADILCICYIPQHTNDRSCNGSFVPVHQLGESLCIPLPCKVDQLVV